MNQLQKALFLNAIFSGLSGTLLILFHNTIARIFDTLNTTVFWVIGAALLYFTATIIYEIKRQKPIAVLFIIIQDFLWVLGSLALLILRPFEITITGYGIIAVVALVVLFIGLRQINALAKVDNKPKAKIKKLSYKRTINSTKSMFKFRFWR